jgi:NAD(P)-dependent dehydrogenase (short-subunit alcohol dehydrogenase family)
VKEVIPGMVEKGWGRIINISSGAAVGGIHRQAAYAASKAGILGFTKAVTLEYAGSGITCNAVMPGMVETPLVRAMPDEIRDGQMQVIPAGRFADPREIAYLVAFLASDRAAYINGVEIHVNGGGHLTPGTLASRKGK